jgi:hypothetical protein
MIDRKIRAVENGLVTANVVLGTRQHSLNLLERMENITFQVRVL